MSAINHLSPDISKREHLFEPCSTTLDNIIFRVPRSRSVNDLLQDNNNRRRLESFDSGIDPNELNEGSSSPKKSRQRGSRLVISIRAKISAKFLSA